MLPPADPAGAKPRRDHRFLARVSRHEVPKTAGKGCLLLTYDPARVSHLPVRQSVRHPSGVGIVMDAWSTGLRGYAPRPRGYAGTRKGRFAPLASLMNGVASLPLKYIASAARAIFTSQAGGVLIRVLMEYGLREISTSTLIGEEGCVLILVLMEYGLREVHRRDPRRET